MINNKNLKLNRGTSKEEDIFSCIKTKKERICASLNEVESFLSNASCCLKFFKLYSILK